MGYIRKYKFENILLFPIKFRWHTKRILETDKLNVNNCHFIIYYAGAIGDCVLASYFVAGLKKEFPKSKITFICIPGAQKLLECFSEIDHVFKSSLFSIRNVNNLLSLKTWRKIYLEYIDINSHVKVSGGYKVLISLTRMDSLLGVYKTKLIASQISNNYSIGLNSNNGRGNYFDDAVADPGNLVEQMTTTWSRILSKLTQKNIQISSNVKCTVKPKIEDNYNIGLEQKYCVMHTGGGSDATQTKWISKRWAATNFYQLADWIVKIYGYKIVFVGTGDEKDPLFDGLNNPNFIDLYGKTTLMQLLPLFKNASIYIGNDSGLAHIASFTGVKTFVIWGYPSYIDYAPIAKNTQLIRLNLSCAPCLHVFDNRLCKNTEWEFKCIKGISIENVKQVIKSSDTK